MKAIVKNYPASKDMRNNWSKRTMIHFDNREVSIVTKASNGILNTRVSCGTVNGQLVSHTMFADYSKLIEQNRYSHTTREVVEKQHLPHVIGKALGDLINEVTDFYKMPRIEHIEFS